MVDPGFSMAHHPSSGGRIERQALAGLQIFFLIFGIGLLFSGDTEHLDIAGEWVVGADPGAVSKVAQQDSVKVEELFGIYTFEQVHQMISTITCKVYPDITFSDIITAVFPMGSMTGAPKMAAMRLIEKYERTKRGLYSGCVGYITPKGNFDLNVVIRSILYNQTDKYISIQAGSAITIDCDAEKEYEECLLKAKAMMEALK